MPGGAPGLQNQCRALAVRGWFDSIALPPVPEEATTVFADPLALIVEDALYPDRARIIGESGHRRILVTVFLENEAEQIRIINARPATGHERRRYEEGEEA